jgi:hypothetical protein
MHVCHLAARFCPRFAFRCPSKTREQGMPDARCTRGLACKRQKRKRTRAYRFSGGYPTFPAQWLYGLYRALPGERIRLVTVAAGLTADRPGWIDFATDSLAPATGVGTTRFCRTLWRRSSCALLLAHGKPPCERTRADAIASTASSPTFVTTRDRPSCRERMGRAGSADLPDEGSEIFFREGLDRVY